MNPLVKKITGRLTETAFSCYLEIILEVFVHNWNRCIEVFNLNFITFDTDYFFGVANVCDAATTYDVKLFTILLDDSNSPSFVITEDSITSEYSILENEFINITTTHDLKHFTNVLRTDKVIALKDSNFHELVITQDSSKYPTSEDEFIDASTTYLTNFTDILMTDELFALGYLNYYGSVISQDSTTSEYSASENKYKVDEGTVLFSEITGDVKNCDSKNPEFTKNNKEDPHYLSAPIKNINENMHFVGDVSKEFQKDAVCDKCNLNPGTEEVPFGNNKSVILENDSKDDPRAVIVKTKYRKSNDDELEKGIEIVHEEKFILSSISVANDTQSESVEKISLINKNGYAFGACSEAESEITPYDIKKSNYIISSEDREKIFLGKESSKHDKEIKFPDNHKSNCVELNLGKKIKEKKASKNRVHFNYEVKTFTFEPLLSVIENFPSDQKLIKENTYMDFINDKHVKKSKNGRQLRRQNQSCITHKFLTDDIHNTISIDKVERKRRSKRIMSRNILRKEDAKESSPCHNNKNHGNGFPELIKENTILHVIKDEEIEESTYDHQRRRLNQTCSNPEFSNAEIDHIHFIDKVNHNIQPKDVMPRHDFLKKESEDSSSINKNDNHDKRVSELVKGNTLSDVIKHVKVEESKCACQRRRPNQDCSNPEFSDTEVDHINFTDKVETNRRPKLSLSRYVFRKNKIEDSPSINMNDNPEKSLSELIKGNTLSDVIKYVELEESKYGCLRPRLNQPCSNPEFLNVEGNHINFIEKAKHNRRPKLSLSRHVFENKKSEHSSTRDENESPGKRLPQLIKENISTYMIKDEEVKESNYDLSRRCRNQDSSLQKLSSAAKPNTRPKLSLSHHVFKFKKSENSSSRDENDNTDKRLSGLIKENVLTYMIKDEEVKVSSYNLRHRRRNHDSSLQKHSNADIDNTSFIDKVEPKRRPKLTLSRHNFQQEKTGKNSLCDKNENADKRPFELIKENAFTDMIKNEKVEQSKYSLQCQLRNQRCGIQEFSTADINNIVFIGNVEPKICSKLSLSRRDFRKMKSEESSQSDKNENPDKLSCEFVKENTLSNGISNEDVEESKYGRQYLLQNQSCSIRENSTVDADNNNFMDKMEPSKRLKLRLSRQLFHKKNTEDSSSRAENENPGKELTETTSKNKLSDMIKNGEIEESNYDRQRRLRNHGCSIQAFSTYDIDNIVYIGKVERKKRPKLFCPHFRKMKSVRNSPRDKNESPGK